MPMSAKKLGDEMSKMEPTEVASEVARGFASAFTTFFYDAQANGSVVPGTLEPAKAAMFAPLGSVSNIGAGAAALQAAIVAFWGVVASSAATIWPGTVGATPPPGLTGIAAALVPVGEANTTGKATRSQAMMNLALVIYAANLGGMATMPPPASPVPIL